MPVVTGPAATRGSCASGAPRCSGSARTRAGVRWSASGNASGTGKRHGPVERIRVRCGVQAVGMAPPVNRDVLIGAGHWLTFNLSRKEGDASAALG